MPTPRFLSRWCLCTGLALLGSGCLLSQSRVNAPLDTAAIDGLAEGQTAEQVVEVLGAPAEVVELRERTAYRYEFLRTKDTALFLFVVNLRRSDTQSDRVWCFFDEQNRLTHLGTTLEAADVEFGLW